MPEDGAQHERLAGAADEGLCVTAADDWHICNLEFGKGGEGGVRDGGGVSWRRIAGYQKMKFKKQDVRDGAGITRG